MTAVEPNNGFWALRQRLLGSQADSIASPADLAAAAEIIYGGQDRFRMYDRSFASLIADQFQLTARTVMECCIDREAVPAADAVRQCWNKVSDRSPGAVIDLFTGSGNLLHWVAAAVDATAIGFETSDAVLQATRENIAKIGTDLELVAGSYDDHTGLLHSADRSGRIFLVDPPWGSGYDPIRGLDLTRTAPPAGRIFEQLRASSGCGPAVVVLKAVEHLSPESWRWLRTLRGLRQTVRMSAVDPRIRTVFFIYEL